MTKRMFVAALFVLLIGAASPMAHHSYSAYDRDAVVSLEGTIEKIVWANPHVLMLVATDTAGTYTAEWWTMNRLQKDGIASDVLKVGDRIVVTGAVNREPEKRIITLLREINRPADGWRWADPRKSRN